MLDKIINWLTSNKVTEQPYDRAQFFMLTEFRPMYYGLRGKADAPSMLIVHDIDGWGELYKWGSDESSVHEFSSIIEAVNNNKHMKLTLIEG